VIADDDLCCHQHQCNNDSNCNNNGVPFVFVTLFTCAKRPCSAAGNRSATYSAPSAYFPVTLHRRITEIAAL
jgi:hypothetical protein